MQKRAVDCPNIGKTVEVLKALKIFRAFIPFNPMRVTNIGSAKGGVDVAQPVLRNSRNHENQPSECWLL